ncbi:MAG: hypothetical protein ACI4IV_07825 [Acutalibacteraceae bacterium]
MKQTITFRGSGHLRVLAQLKWMLGTLCPDKLYDIVITEHRQKRSLDANKYMWQLIGQMAQVLSIPAVEIYRGFIREVGAFKDITLPRSDAPTLRKAWEKLGIGWPTEVVDDTDSEWQLIRFFYGSSSYNTKQMSVLIDRVVQECEDLEIETKTPDEIERLVSLWEAV